ncbi:unnamed protein product, partial [Laminaria digitata]
ALCVVSADRAEDMNRLLFELLARWVSGLIPGVALLHIMCKTKKPGDDRPAGDQTRLKTVSEDQPLNEPLLPTRGRRSDPGARRPAEPGYPGGMTKGGGASGNNREQLPSSSNAGASGGRAGGGAGRDSFVYHVIRSQAERTETTI